VKKERDRAHPAIMATPEERLLLQRASKIARQRANYRELRQALLDAFPHLPSATTRYRYQGNRVTGNGVLAKTKKR
jgi:hypothetical protein